MWTTRYKASGLEQVTDILRQMNHPACPPKASLEFVERVTLKCESAHGSAFSAGRISVEQPA